MRTLHHAAAALVCAALLLPALSRADNAMGYRLLDLSEATGLPHNGGALGMDVGRAQRISDGGMTFEILQVKAVRRGSPAAQAGLGVGDDLIAIDSRVFPSVAAFAAYIGSVPPGTRVALDYIPAGGGPQQAQRIPLTVGRAGRAARSQGDDQRTGLSTGEKVAIGAGAAALLGCYEIGCFRSRTAAPPTVGAPNQRYPQQGYPQR